MKLTRDLLESDAWRSLGINSRRLIDFLMREHLAHGGRENGRLKAPQHQLAAYGISKRHVGKAIEQAETLGLIACRRHGLKVASDYALTWLPTHDNTPPTDQWRLFRDPALLPLPTPKVRNLPPFRKVGLPPLRKADGRFLPPQSRADEAANLPSLRKDLSR